MLTNFKNPCWYKHSNAAGMEIPFCCAKNVSYKSKCCKGILQTRIKLESRKKILMCAPYFLLVGVPKCGTSDIFSQIMSHPLVAKPFMKEPMYWNRYWPHGLYGTDAYEEVFLGAAERIEKSIDGNGIHHMITGEGTTVTFPSYMYRTAADEPILHGEFPHIAKAIHKYNPRIRIIVVFREPVRRLLSRFIQQSHFVRRHLFNISSALFDQKVTEAMDWWEMCLATNSQRHCLHQPINPNTTWTAHNSLREGFYVEHLREWLEVFPREQILILRTEDYATDRAPVMDKVFSFLNLPPFNKNSTHISNKTPKTAYDIMSNVTRAVLNRLRKKPV